MSTRSRRWTQLVTVIGLAMSTGSLRAQPLGEPDRGSPGDAMIQAYLARETLRLERPLAEDFASLDAWQARRPEYVAQYWYMLGLVPDQPRTPLAATVTGTIHGEGYVVEKLHYQSRPRLYVTANLYRPADAPAGKKHPAILYVCGHSGRGRNGNKVAFQSHGIWLARHGYVCLVVDTLQLGEIAAIHHGTYHLERWWWHARGYTPAGVEAWNGIRGIDYLLSRPDVDGERIAVTGISGGGAATFWVAAADERVRVAVPVSGMADLEAYVPNRVINGHCDCMFMYNTFQWPWTRIAALCAPRPLQFINSDQDAIFPMDANERISNRLERLYSLFGAGDQFETVVSVGGHAYRQDIRRAVYRFLNTHLHEDPRPVPDSEIDVVSEGSNPGDYPIEPEKLRVFPTDADIPDDELNTTIDEHFVPVAESRPLSAERWSDWRTGLLAELQRVSFASWPQEIPAARRLEASDDRTERLETEDGIWVALRYPQGRLRAEAELLLIVAGDEEGDWARDFAAGRPYALLEPRGVGETRWTRKNPPNYVERSHALLGRTVDTGRVRDVVAVARYLSRREGGRHVVRVAGRRASGLLAAYAAALDGQIAGAEMVDPPATHQAPGAPQFLNILRVADVPDILGLIAPRPLRIRFVEAPAFELSVTRAAYDAAGAAERLDITP